MRFVATLVMTLLITIAFVFSGCDGGDEEELERVPLSEVYFTSIQKGLKAAGLHDRLPFRLQVDGFNVLRPTVSNLFLARANGIEEAIEAGIRFRGDDKLTLPKNSEGDQIWLIVFFGQGHSSPQRWIIDSVEYNQSKIRMNFRGPGLGTTTRDIRPYIAFVPMPGLKAGKYALELRDAGSKEVALLFLSAKPSRPGIFVSGPSA
jgi:hypothetical protein